MPLANNSDHSPTGGGWRLFSARKWEEYEKSVFRTLEDRLFALTSDYLLKEDTEVCVRYVTGGLLSEVPEVDWSSLKVVPPDKPTPAPNTCLNVVVNYRGDRDMFRVSPPHEVETVCGSAPDKVNLTTSVNCGEWGDHVEKIARWKKLVSIHLSHLSVKTESLSRHVSNVATHRVTALRAQAEKELLLAEGINNSGVLR